MFIDLVSIAQPVVNQFSPTSGPVGSSVTITGSGFSTNPTSNIVYFGATRATVSAASVGSLTVKVPPGATYQPISISVGGLTAFSNKPFITTFPSGLPFQQGPNYTQYILGPDADFTTGLYPNGIATADFDGDGKPDLATSNNFLTAGAASISILRNISTSHQINFSPKQDLTISGLAFCIAAGDLDGDGKPDIVAGSINAQSIYVYKNSSTTGNISFSAPMTYPSGTNPYCVAIADIDGDGKPDLISANYLAGNFSVFRNTTANSVLSFAAKVDFTTGLGPRCIAIADLNNDGKADLAIVDELSNSLQIFPNTSSAGQIAFAAPTTYTTGSNPYGIAIGDLDQDGKPDLAVVNNQSGTLSIFRNTTSGSTIALGSKTDYNTTIEPNGVVIADLNGDGLPDITVIEGEPSLYQNTSTVGNISLSSGVFAKATVSAFAGVIADFDLDGKNDVALANLGGKASVLRNIDNEPSLKTFSPSTAPAGGTVLITGENFANATAVTFGGIAAASFTLINDTSINAVVGAGISGDIAVTTGYGTGSASGFVYAGPPTVTGFTPAAAGAGDTVTITGTNLTGAIAISFGGVMASSFTVTSPTSITAIVGSGASGGIIVYTPYGSGSIAGFTLIPPPQISTVSPDSAISGATITITGQNFATTQAVTFGGIAASSFTIVSSTVIQAVVGAGATGDVDVTSIGGTSVYHGFVFLPPPSITAVSPDSGATGTKIVLTGNDFQNVSSVDFGGVPASSFYYQSPTQIVAIPAAGASGNISVVTPFGAGQWPGFTFTSSPTISSFTPVSAGNNDVIQITGTHLDSITAVSFGGTPAKSFTITSPTSISAIVAQGSSGDITVSTPYSSASQDGFLFTGAPTITSITPSGVGPGSVITITGSNFTGTQSVQLGGSPATSFTVLNASTIQATVATAATNDSIAITNLYGSVAIAGLSFDNRRPSITSISPVSGIPGTRITITGANFNPSAANNIIFFGAVRATPISATPNTIIVSVPISATYAPVSVTVNGLTAFSGNFFLPVFYANDSAFTTSSFQVSSWESGVDAADYVVISDLNNDGKPDLVVADHFYNLTGTVTEENSSTPGNIQFPAVGINNKISNDPFSVAVADFDGDGKPDIASANQFGYTVSVSRNNIPTGSTLYFQDSSSFPTGNLPQVIAAADMDGDGKPDIAVINNQSNSVSILLNNTTGGNLSFLPKHDLNTPSSPYSLALADLNSDGKPDITLTSSASAGMVSIFLNTSSPGALSFSNRIDIPCGSLLTGIAVGDLDGDGKPDIAAASQYSGLSILRNTGSNGNISFSAPLTVQGSFGGPIVALGDLDGDGKPEIVIGNGENSTLTIHKNKSVPGVPYFAAGATVGSSYNVNGLAIGDIDGDGKPDIVTTNAIDIVDVFRNSIPSATPAAPAITSFTPDSAYTGTPVTITGTNLDRVSSVSFGSTPAASFIINSPNSITAIVDTGSTGYVNVSNTAGTASLSGFIYLKNPTPSITAFTPDSARQGNTVTITGTNFNNVAVVAFGGQPVASFTVNSPASIEAVLGSGASGKVTVITKDGTASVDGFTFILPATTTSANTTTNTDSIAVYPNPANGQTTFIYPSSPNAAALLLVNAQGNVIKTYILPPGTTQLLIDLKNLPKGVYRLEWTDGSHKKTKSVLVI